MKSFYLFLLTFLLLCVQPAKADLRIGRYDFLDNGYFFTKASFPQSASNSLDGSNDISIENLENLKKGVSVTRSFFNLVAIGDASIHKAAKEANITNIKYVDIEVAKVYIPIGCIPIAAKEVKTIVYGE
jgi:hypothetical protein